MITKVASVLLMGVFLAASPLAGEQNRGAPQMVLQGGSSGNVSFPHHRHQDVLGDCNLCHNLFPQIPGSIEKLKEEGKLKKKEVMERCRSCHRQKAEKGEKAGPTGCKVCHQK
jgi:hypothetical protein